MAMKTTETDSGMVMGRVCGNPGYTVFKGIPYAEETSGNNRFAPPKPVKKWDGVRLCDEFSEICVQENKIPGIPFMDFFIREFYPYEYPMGENSLCLNVWTPADSPGEKLPVMVWIHGGGLGSGYGHEMEFDGEMINKRGVILVTINYRVGVLGCFAHPEISGENGGESGNLWLLDQAEALKWVKRNIGAFGGDSENITIFGQSAGGMSVISQLISPESEGLFQKAIIQSGSFGIDSGLESSTLADGEAWGVKACRILGKTVAELRAMSGQEAFDALTYAEKNGAGPIPKMLTGGGALPYPAEKAFREGLVKNVPLMAGSVNGDKGLLRLPDMPKEKKALFPIISRLGEHTEKFLEQYPIGGKGGEVLAELDRYSTNAGDITIGYSNEKNGHIPAYLYYFEPLIPEKNESSFVEDGIAYHSSELWYIFGVLDRCWRRFDGRHYELSQKMTDYWTNFAKTGDPNGGGLPKWEKFTMQSPGILHMSEKETGLKKEDIGNIELLLDFRYDTF